MADQGSRQLGARLRELREDRGLTQEQLALELHTSQSYVARVEGGQLEPRLDTLRRWALALGYTRVGIAFRVTGRQS